jgi:hypothetical protein
MKLNASMEHKLRAILCILLASVPNVASMQMRKEALESKTGQGPLYMVNVNYDWEEAVQEKAVTIVFDEEAYAMRVDKGIDKKNGIAWATLSDRLDKTGWMKLSVHTNDAKKMSRRCEDLCSWFCRRHHDSCSDLTVL